MDYGHGPAADRLAPDEYLERMQLLIQLCIVRLKSDGSIWFLTPEVWADAIGTMLSGHLHRRNRIIWRETFGQYRVDRFPSGHRHLFWHCRPGASFFTDDIRVLSQRMIAGDKRAAGPRLPDDVWQFPRLVGNAAERIAGHPCQLPEALLERIIRCSTQPGDLVLDPMAGTGTTMRVAQRLDRPHLGIEKERVYVELIQQRLSQPIQRELFE